MFYRWPQGRIIRTITMAVATLIAADFGWSAYEMWMGVRDGTVVDLINAILLTVLGTASLLSGVIFAGIYPRSAQFLIEVEKEMTKVDWPDRPTVIRSTIVISIMTAVLATLIFLVDSLNYVVFIEGLFRMFTGGQA